MRSHTTPPAMLLSGSRVQNKCDAASSPQLAFVRWGLDPAQFLLGPEKRHFDVLVTRVHYIIACLYSRCNIYTVTYGQHGDCCRFADAGVLWRTSIDIILVHLTLCFLGDTRQLLARKWFCGVALKLKHRIPWAGFLRASTHTLWYFHKRHLCFVMKLVLCRRMKIMWSSTFNSA